MDDTEALLARTVARAARAWLSSPLAPDLYRRLVEATADYDTYLSPRLPLSEDDTADLDGDEVLDDLGSNSEPMLLGEGLAHLDEALRARARRTL